MSDYYRLASGKAVHKGERGAIIEAMSRGEIGVMPSQDQVIECLSPLRARHGERVIVNWHGNLVNVYELNTLAYRLRGKRLHRYEVLWVGGNNPTLGRRFKG
jgi:hypothetical protein